MQEVNQLYQLARSSLIVLMGAKSATLQNIVLNARAVWF